MIRKHGNSNQNAGNGECVLQDNPTVKLNSFSSELFNIRFVFFNPVEFAEHCLLLILNAVLYDSFLLRTFVDFFSFLPI